MVEVCGGWLPAEACIPQKYRPNTPGAPYHTIPSHTYKTILHTLKVEAGDELGISGYNADMRFIATVDHIGEGKRGRRTVPVLVLVRQNYHRLEIEGGKPWSWPSGTPLGQAGCKSGAGGKERKKGKEERKRRGEKRRSVLRALLPLKIAKNFGYAMVAEGMAGVGNTVPG